MAKSDLAERSVLPLQAPLNTKLALIIIETSLKNAKMRQMAGMKVSRFALSVLYSKQNFK